MQTLKLSVNKVLVMMYSVFYKEGGPIPHNLAQTFDGPPTLERSGPEHRVGRLHPHFLRKRGLGRMWSSPCRRDGEVEKMTSLMVKKDGMILEQTLL